MSGANSALREVFGDIINSYTEENALEDGFLTQLGRLATLLDPAAIIPMSDQLSALVKQGSMVMLEQLTNTQVVATCGIMILKEKDTNFLRNVLTQFAGGRWGDCYPDRKRANDDALTEGLLHREILAVYQMGDDTIWVKQDGPIITILLPEEY